MSGKIKNIKLYLLPVALVLGLVPLLIHLKYYETGLEKYGTFGFSQSNDIFLYYKAMVFIILCTVMVVLIIAQACVKHIVIKAERLFIPLVIYIFLSFISAVFSKYGSFSFTGIYEQFESIWVILGYAIVVYYCYLFIAEAKHINMLMTALIISAVIMLLIGLSQAFSQDIFRSSLGSKIILPVSQWDQADTLKFNFPLGRVYLTLYNPNYVGSYVALLSPVFLMLVFAKKKIWYSILCAVIYVGLLLCILGSGSRAGYIGVVASLILLGCVYNKRLIKILPEVIIVLVLIVGVVYTYNNYTNGQLVSRFKSALEIEKSDYNLLGIETNDGNLVINYKGHLLRYSFWHDETTDDYSITVLDEDGESIPFSVNGVDFTTDDERYKNISFFMTRSNGMTVIVFKIDGKEWDFAYIYDSYYYLNNLGNWTKINTPEYIESLDNYGKAISGRFYMWSRTLPLLKDKILLGSGPDTFMLEFPNDDYVGRYNVGFEEELITKPHNMYLQIAVQTGILSLICFLVFYFWYFVSSIRTYRKADKSDYLVKIGTGVLCGTFGYMIVGLINDSMVVTAPLFWTLIGVGIACNNIIKKNNKLDAVFETIEKSENKK